MNQLEAADSAPMEIRPKYSLLEIERRWLVKPELARHLENLPFMMIEDLYLEASRLRLRKVVEPDGKEIFKLGKKYGKQSRYIEPITNLYLDIGEYRALRNLPGYLVQKRRYKLYGGSVDLYLEPNANLMIFEIEFENEGAAQSFSPPDMALREITGDDKFSGYSLAKKQIPGQYGK